MNVRNIACACILTAGLTAMSVWADSATGPSENKTEAPAPSAAVAGTVTNMAPTVGMKPAESVPVPAVATNGMADTNSVSAASEPSPAPALATTATPPNTNATPAIEGSPQITIDFVDYDLQGALRRLAAKAGINLILGEEVTGKVTVHLEDVPYVEAMQLIAESKGYAFIQDKTGKNLVKVKSKESLDLEPVEVRMYVLRYAKADDLAKTIERFLTKQGKIQVDARSNTLIISDTPSNLTKIMPLVEALDAQAPQVLIEAKFIETTKNPLKDLGINWSGTLLNHEFIAGSTAGTVDPITGKPQAGFQWSKKLGTSAPWVSSTALLDAGQAQVILSYLNQDTDTELLANPRVVTIDNGKAKIAIAEQYPIPEFQFSEQTGAFQISGFQYRDIGIILNVTPRINKDEFVTLEVAPEASSRSGVATLASGSSSVQIPIIDTRTATTTVLIKSGNTLAIGGLMRQDVSDTYTKVPLMGDIPGLGSFFRSKSLSKKKRDLLIFLTPTIVGPEAQTGYEKYSGGLPSEEVYANDKWMPKDNAKARPLFKGNGSPSSP
ncbi:MAG: secretin N-terminal domain-containing protein [Verrucomicrobiia bacterium]